MIISFRFASVPLLCGALLTASPAMAGLTFQVDARAGTPVAMIEAFDAAANIWSRLFTDDVAIRITIGAQTTAPTTLATTLAPSLRFGYSAVNQALTADALGSTDIAAMLKLPEAASIAIYLNHTLNSPYGPGSNIGYVDNNGDVNNSTINMTTANARAMGLTVPLAKQTMVNCVATCDGYINFNPTINFDYNRSNGISANQFDFIGIAAHEIGHLLGFISGVDTLDQFSSRTYYPDSAFNFVTPLDLFRCSPESFAAGGLIDWTVHDTRIYFSLLADCSAPLGEFSTGKIWGDGYGAAHWRNNRGLGIMDPTTAAGELLVLSDRDLLAFDAIGWDLASNAVPAPGGGALLGLALFALATLREVCRQIRTSR
jgi:hypothetical protein